MMFSLNTRLYVIHLGFVFSVCRKVLLAQRSVNLNLLMERIYGTVRLDAALKKKEM